MSLSVVLIAAGNLTNRVINVFVEPSDPLTMTLAGTLFSILGIALGYGTFAYMLWRKLRRPAQAEARGLVNPDER